MNRRGFLGMLAALPFAKALPESTNQTINVRGALAGIDAAEFRRVWDDVNARGTYRYKVTYYTTSPDGTRVVPVRTCSADDLDAL